MRQTMPVALLGAIVALLLVTMRFGLPADSTISNLTTGDWIAIIGDLLVFIGLAVTLGIYLVQRNASIRREINSTLEVLRAVQNGITTWGKKYFTTSYFGQLGVDRAKDDYHRMIKRDPAQNFRVPTEALTSLIQQPETGLLIDRNTIEAANEALWKIGVFNQMVQAQTDFNALHISEVMDKRLPDADLEALALASQRISEQIHKDGIEDAGWYERLQDALDQNIRTLTDRDQEKWRILKRPDRVPDTNP
jgi:hypothetical protein